MTAWSTSVDFLPAASVVDVLPGVVLTATLVAQAPPRPVATADATRRTRPTPAALVILAFTILAAGLRLYRLYYGYAHAVIDYDSGVYLGSSLEVVQGHLPYRDFVFVQPPGITVLMAPVALLAKVIGTGQAMGLAKILTGLAGAASVPLVGWLVRGRGLVAVAIACGVVAFQGDAVASGYSLLLEPWLVLFCLLGAVLVFDGDRLAGGRRLWWGGALFGFACAVKIWAFAPVLAVVLICRPDRRRARTYLTGTAAGFLIPVLPFLIAAPSSFVHEVLTVQLFRSADVRTSFWLRLIHIFTVAAPTGSNPSTATGVLVAGAILIAVSLGLVWRRCARGASPLERFAVLAAALVVALLLVPDTFYWHYAAFSTPFLALAAALPLSRLAGRSRRLWAGLLVCGVVGLALTMTHRDWRYYGVRDEYAQVASVVPAHACVVTSMLSATIADDRFFGDSGHCPAFVDAFGSVLSLTDGDSPSPGAVQSVAVRRLWLGLFERADYLYLVQSHSPTIPSDPALRSYLAAHFRVAPLHLAGTLYVRDGLPS